MIIKIKALHDFPGLGEIVTTFLEFNKARGIEAEVEIGLGANAAHDASVEPWEDHE